MSQSSPSAPFKLQEVSFGYPDLGLILEELSISFPLSSVTAVLGKSGSGKSTLLQLLNGMLKPLSGVVTLFGQPFDYQNPVPLRRRIGYVVQQAGLFPHLSLIDNISLPGRITGLEKSHLHERTRELMELARLPLSYLEKFPHQLSGGEQQRAGLCRALFLKPALLLMDEPFSALDEGTRKGLYEDFLRLLQLQPATVVLVTHNLKEAYTLSDRYLWIAKGQLRTQGEREELLAIRPEYENT
jgi:osmoprotectant transport system ATP-binding protein